jgi:DNA-binding transcriptional MerR regulator
VAEGDAPPPAVPAGLTLKAVSRRTGIPAATLRTWERRYRFLRPERASNGYRSYGEEEIARILHVKHLLEQGVRIGQAMETVEESHPRRATGVTGSDPGDHVGDRAAADRDRPA